MRVGLIRTEELLRRRTATTASISQYFTTVVDYGFSKRLDEALDKWGRENVLRDVVRVIRDGAALRADRALPGQRARRPRQPSGRRSDHAGRVHGRRRSDMFPEQLAAGPAAVAAAEAVHGRRARERGLDAPRRYRRLRSRAGRLLSDTRAPRPQLPALAERRPLHVRSLAPRVGYYKRLQSVVDAPRRKQASSTASTPRIPGIYQRAAENATRRAPAALLAAIDREVKAAVQAFKMDRSLRARSPRWRGRSRRPATAITQLGSRSGRRPLLHARRSSRSPTRSTPRSASASPRSHSPPARRSRPVRSTLRVPPRWRRSYPARPSMCERRSSTAARSRSRSYRVAVTGKGQLVDRGRMRRRHARS